MTQTKCLGGKMVRCLMGLLCAMLILIPVLPSAQGPAGGQGIGPAGCPKLAELGLSETQLAALRMIEERYTDRVTRQRNEMMIKRIELQTLIRDPKAAEDAIRIKAEELGAVQDELRKTMIDYQIEIRRNLTADQLRNWCTLLGEPGPWMGR